MTVARKFACADNLTILHYASNWNASEETLTQDVAILLTIEARAQYNHGTTKTVSPTFHFYNKESRRELIFVNGQTLCAEPIYLGIKLNRALTLRQHLGWLYTIKFLAERLLPQYSICV